MPEMELDRLRDLGELRVSDEVALKLKAMSSATINRKLKHQREVLHLLRSKGGPKPGSLLKRKIPIRLTEWDTSKIGYVEMDLVVHCGSSTFGEYINTLGTIEVSSGWWEAEAIMGKSQKSTFQALKKIRERTPFDWKGLDSDNGSEFINETLYPPRRIAVERGLSSPGLVPAGRMTTPILSRKTGCTSGKS